MISPEEVDAFVADVYPAIADAGVTCADVSEGRSLMRWRYQESELRPGGYISGPTQMTLADAGLWVASFTLIGFEAMAVTADLSMTFLRPALGDDLYARTEVLSRTRRRIHGTVRLWVGSDETRLVSHAVGSYAVPS